MPAFGKTATRDTLFSAALNRGIVLSFTSSFDECINLSFTPIVVRSGTWVAAFRVQEPPEQLYFRLDRNAFAWREDWQVQLSVEGETITLSLDQPEAMIDCPPAQTVWIEATPVTSPFPKIGAITLQELSTGRKTKQSSAEEPRPGVWMTPTLIESHPWWEIDLEHARYLEQVRIYFPRSTRSKVRIETFVYRRPNGTITPSWSVESSSQEVLTLTARTVARFLRITVIAESVALELKGIDLVGTDLHGRSLLGGLRRTFTLFRQRNLFVQGDQKGQITSHCTYGEVWQQVQRFAAGLRKLLNGRQQAQIGICAPNCPEWVIADLACILLGYSVVPLPPHREQLEEILGQVELQAVVCSSDVAPVFDITRIVIGPPFDDAIRFEDVDDNTEIISPIRRFEPFTGLFTSGSTGSPKPIWRSFDQFEHLIRSLDVTQPAVHLSFQPLHHFSERVTLPSILRYGGQVGFCRNIDNLLHELAELRPTMIGAVPRIFELMRSFALDHPTIDLESLLGGRLQAVSVGGAPINPELRQFLQTRFSNCWVTDVYGTSETGEIAVNGMLLEDVEVKLVDAGVGKEIWVRTDHLAVDPELLDSDGFYRTGDLGSFNEDGLLEVEGRANSVMKASTGEFVALERIETMLEACPLVDKILLYLDEELVALVWPADPTVSSERMLLGLIETAGSAGLRSFETPSVVRLVQSPLTTENGSITASLKPCRQRIIELNRDTIESALAEAVATRAQRSDAVLSVFASMVGKADPDTIPTDIGVDSLVSLELSLRLEARTGLKVPPSAWLANRSIKAIAHGVFDATQTDQVEMLEGDLQMPLPFAAESGSFAPKNILLTGGSGLLGMHLLESIDNSTSVTCLVRNHVVVHDSRVRLLEGDLSRGRLGLDRSSWDTLAAEIDCIIHSGAEVHWLLPYQALRDVNVIGSRTLIELAMSGRPKVLHYISSMSCAAVDGIEDSTLPLEEAAKQSGYIQSKWIAEQLVVRARKQGLSAVLHRPGLIGCHSTRGTCKREDFLARLLVGCLQLGLFPDVRHRIDFTPVDYVAEAITASLNQKRFENETLHLTNLDASPSYRQLGRMLQDLGWRIELVPYHRFREVLAESPMNVLHPFLPFFPKDAGRIRIGPWPHARTKRRLNKLKVDCPTVDRAVIDRMLSWLGPWVCRTTSRHR